MENGLTKIQSNYVSKVLYAKLLDLLNSIGNYEVEVKKTSLHIVNGRAFLGVHPRSKGLLINIVLSEPVDSKRLKKSERVSANRYHNEIVISDVEDIDSEVIDWLKEAYALTST